MPANGPLPQTAPDSGVTNPASKEVPSIFGRRPNIWGAFTTLYGVLRTANGGFAVESQVSTLMDAKPEGGNSYELLNFSAERVSAIFGSSDVVQPSAVRTLVLIRAF